MSEAQALAVRQVIALWRERAGQQGAIYASGILEFADELEAALGEAPASEKGVEPVAQVLARLHADLPRPEAGEAKEGRMMTRADRGWGWQPIETAPKDGRPILICERYGFRCAAQWLDGRWTPWMPFPPGEIRIEPTNWMPLPDPPNQH